MRVDRIDPREAALPGALLGIGVMGAVDEIVFHQVLQWHHFFVHTGSFGQIFSDGLFHALTASLLVVAAIVLWVRRRRFAAIVTSRTFWGATLLGMGAFQVFDGTVNHKLLRLHPVRVGIEDQLPYDIAWIGSGVVLLAAGWLVWRTGSDGSHSGR